jgi:hypothetical protein
MKQEREFHVHLAADHGYYETTILADNLAQALEKAKLITEADPIDFVAHFEDDGVVQYVRVTDPDSDDEDDYSRPTVEDAAHDLLAAAELARRELREFYSDDCQSEALRLLSLAIGKAKGGAV